MQCNVNDTVTAMSGTNPIIYIYIFLLPEYAWLDNINYILYPMITWKDYFAFKTRIFVLHFCFFILILLSCFCELKGKKSERRLSFFGKKK